VSNGKQTLQAKLRRQVVNSKKQSAGVIMNVCRISKLTDPTYQYRDLSILHDRSRRLVETRLPHTATLA